MEEGEIELPPEPRRATQKEVLDYVETQSRPKLLELFKKIKVERSWRSEGSDNYMEIQSLYKDKQKDYVGIHSVHFDKNGLAIAQIKTMPWMPSSTINSTWKLLVSPRLASGLAGENPFEEGDGCCFYAEKTDDGIRIRIDRIKKIAPYRSRKTSPSMAVLTASRIEVPPHIFHWYVDANSKVPVHQLFIRILKSDGHEVAVPKINPGTLHKGIWSFAFSERATMMHVVVPPPKDAHQDHIQVALRWLFDITEYPWIKFDEAEAARRGDSQATFFLSMKLNSKLPLEHEGLFCLPYIIYEEKEDRYKMCYNFTDVNGENDFDHTISQNNFQWTMLDGKGHPPYVVLILREDINAGRIRRWKKGRWINAVWIYGLDGPKDAPPKTPANTYTYKSTQTPSALASLARTWAMFSEPGPSAMASTPLDSEESDGDGQRPESSKQALQAKPKAKTKVKEAPKVREAPAPVVETSQKSKKASGSQPASTPRGGLFSFNFTRKYTPSTSESESHQRKDGPKKPKKQ